MSQHVTETCNESNGHWLPLTEYAVKSGVSLSTIRRKIKSNSIPFRLEKGRYLIFFGDADPGTTSHRAAQPAPIFPRMVETSVEEPSLTAPAPRNPATDQATEERLAMPLVERAVQMVSQAFEHALREKDERIRLLEQRNSELEERLLELRTLVKVLEEKYEVRY
jgi:hypothetical protein